MSIFSSIFKGFTNPVGTLINAGTSILGGVLSSNAAEKNAQYAYESQKLANQGNMELAKYAYSQNLEQWNRQNAYNTPQAQMERYKEAGLNPNLIYSQGSNGNAASSPTYNPPTLQPASRNAVDYGQVIGNSIGQFNNLRLQQKEIELKDAQINNINSQASYNAVREALGGTQISLNNQLYGFRGSYNPLSLNYLSQRINNEVINANVLSQRAQNLAQEEQLLIANRRMLGLQYRKGSLEYKLAKQSYDDQLMQIRAQRVLTESRAFGEQLQNDVRKFHSDYVKNNGMTYSTSPLGFVGGAFSKAYNSVGKVYEKGRSFLGSYSSYLPSWSDHW